MPKAELNIELTLLLEMEKLNSVELCFYNNGAKLWNSHKVRILRICLSFSVALLQSNPDM